MAQLALTRPQRYAGDSASLALRSTNGDTASFSVDDVSVVPEPSVIGLLALAGGAMLRRRQM